MEESLYPGADMRGAGAAVVSGNSAASWPAIIAGAFVAIATTLVLFTLGVGLGFASISPWADHGMSRTTFAVTAAIWLIVTQWISAALGGYIAGRLRSRWHGTHTHEIFFRDTANGLITWAVATVVIAAFAGTSVRSMIAGGMHSNFAISAAATPETGAPAPLAAYLTDRLFRSTHASLGGASANYRRIEAADILGNTLVTGSLPIVDRAYLSEAIATDTGISAADAQLRIDSWVAGSLEAAAKVKAEADTARSAAARAAIYSALALLVGAFIASVAAALGGRLRDEHP